MYWAEACITIKKSAEALLVTNNEPVLDVNAEKTSCITLPRGQNSRLINVGNYIHFKNCPKTSELHA
jgi:hypothetical protein